MNVGVRRKPGPIGPPYKANRLEVTALICFAGTQAKAKTQPGPLSFASPFRRPGPVISRRRAAPPVRSRRLCASFRVQLHFRYLLYLYSDSHSCSYHSLYSRVVGSRPLSAPHELAIGPPPPLRQSPPFAPVGGLSCPASQHPRRLHCQSPSRCAAVAPHVFSPCSLASHRRFPHPAARFPQHLLPPSGWVVWSCTAGASRADLHPRGLRPIA